jgi:hypothetical protein
VKKLILLEAQEEDHLQLVLDHVGHLLRQQLKDLVDRQLLQQ